MSGINSRKRRKKRPNVHKFGPQFWGRTTPTFLLQVVSAIHCPPFGKVWLSSVWSPSAKPSNEAECRIYGRWVNDAPVLIRLWTKVHVVLRWYRRPLVVANTHADCLYRVLFERYRALKLPLRCKVIEKGGFESPILEGEDIPQISNMRLQIAPYFRSCGWFWLSSVQRARRVGDEKEDRR